MSAASERTVLVTGVNGQVGFELARTLQGLGRIVALDRKQFDLSNLDQIRTVIRDVKPALIVNPAAYTAVDQAEQDTGAAMRVNGEAPGVIAEEAKRLGAALIHYSTDYVFDGMKSSPYDEDDATSPQNVYGRSKLAGEQAIAASGCAHVIFRTSWVYGHRSKSFFSTMLTLAVKRQRLRVVGDQFGAPTWSVLLAAMTAQLIAQGLAARGGMEAWWQERSGIYHLTGGGVTSWAGFAGAIFEALPEMNRPKLDAIATSEYPTPAKRPANSRLDNDKIARVFGLRAPDWTHSLSLCIAEAKKSAAFSALFQTT